MKGYWYGDSIMAAMQTLPAEIYSVAAVREIDRAATNDEGIPGYSLMARAGAAAMRFARERFADARRWQVVCGAGNNAGDGYIVARLAAGDPHIPAGRVNQLRAHVLAEPTALDGGLSPAADQDETVDHGDPDRGPHLR